MLEPPSFVSEKKSYSTYKNDLRRWARITTVKKELQAEVVVYSLEGHPSGIKEKIDVQIGKKLQENEKGIEDLIEYLDTIYEKDEMSDAWHKYKTFQKVSRKNGQEVMAFIAEFEKEYTLAKAAGCSYSDTILAFRLLEATGLTENDEKFVLTAIDFKEGKSKGNLLEQIKSSLKKFQGRTVVTESKKDGIKVDADIIDKVKSALISEGWKSPKNAQEKANGGTPQNSPNYQGKKNPLGADGKALKCFRCASEYHMVNKCPRKADEKKTEEKEKKGKNVSDSADESGLISTVLSAVKGRRNGKASKAFLATTTTNVTALKLDKRLSEEECSVVMVNEDVSSLCLLVEDAGDMGVIDTACSKTVAGANWIVNYLRSLIGVDHDEIPREESDTVYQFGGGEKRRSVMRIGLPALVGDQSVTIFTEIVDADIPMLIGANSLRKAKAKLNFEDNMADIAGSLVPMKMTKSGHFCIELFSPYIATHMDDVKEREEMVMSVLVASTENTKALTVNELKKLHHLFGHTSVDRLVKLLKESGLTRDILVADLKKVKETCEACQRCEKSKPKPKMAINRAEKFNQVVTMDLKTYDLESKDRKYILYLVDMFSRLTAAKFISSKDPCKIIEVILEKWIGAGYGVMEFLHSDIGGEFSNDELRDVAANLNIKLTTTAAYSPHQNGINERNHATVDMMLNKMIESDPSMKPETALLWALNAKNSLANHNGFSSYQLVYGVNPSLPNNMSNGVASLENVTVSETFAKHLNAMNQARKEFIQAESSDTVKKALKSRIYAKGDDICEGDWIYYKKSDGKNKNQIWRGPDKVVAVNGKKLFVDHGARLSTVNRDQSVRMGEEYWRAEDVMNEANENGDRSEGGEGRQIFDDIEDEIVPTNGENNTIQSQPMISPRSNTINSQPEREITTQSQLDEILQGPNNEIQSQTTDVNFRLEKGNRIVFRHPETNEEIRGRVVNRAGKSTGRYKDWWNIENLDTGETASHDVRKIGEIRHMEDVQEDQVENAFVVTIPRWQHNEPRCQEAKEKELKSWDDFGVYKEVKDEGQKTIGLSWVLVEKLIDGEQKVKARLCARGDMEVGSFRTDSPTIQKSNLKLFFTIALSKKWTVKTCDIKCAFLQGEKLERDVFVRPPKERRVNGVIWKMETSVYGLQDASRGFYLELSNTLKGLNCVQSKYDSALYYWYDENGKLEGMLATHVDDIIHGSGSPRFEKRVMDPLRNKFQVGSEETAEFRYVGMKIEQFRSVIKISQEHYLASVEVPDVPLGKDEDIMTEEGQEIYRGVVGKIGWLGTLSRPDLAFDHVSLSTKLGCASIGDMKYAVKTLKKLKMHTGEMIIQDLGDIEDWSVEGYGDAGFRSLPEKVNSCGGKVVILRNRKSNKASVLSWRSKKLKRVVSSSTAAETLAMVETISDMMYTKAILEEIMKSEREIKIPLYVYTDSKNLWKCLHSTALVEDPRLRIDVAIIKESLEKGEIDQVIKIDSKNMIADSLTKKGASAKKLMELLKTGIFKPEEG